MKDYPLWAFLYWLTGLGCITLILWVGSNNFDNEPKYIGKQGVLTALVFGILEMVRRRS